MTLGLAGAVAVRLGKLPIELLMVPPQPAASSPAASRVTGRESLFAERRMLILPRRGWPTAGACVGRAAGIVAACPDGLARPGDLQAAWLGGFCLRHHRDCAAPRLGSDRAISAPRSAAASCARALRSRRAAFPSTAPARAPPRRQVPVSAEVADAHTLAVSRMKTSSSKRRRIAPTPPAGADPGTFHHLLRGRLHRHWRVRPREGMTANRPA